MSEVERYWLVVGLVGVGTFLTRASFVAFYSSGNMPDVCLRALRFIPPAVMTAIILPSLFVYSEEVVSLSRPLAAVVAGLVAWKSRNVLATIGAGMGCYWAICWVSQSVS